MKVCAKEAVHGACMGWHGRTCSTLAVHGVAGTRLPQFLSTVLPWLLLPSFQVHAPRASRQQVHRGGLADQRPSAASDQQEWPAGWLTATSSLYPGWSSRKSRSVLILQGVFRQ